MKTTPTHPYPPSCQFFRGRGKVRLPVGASPGVWWVHVTCFKGRDDVPFRYAVYGKFARRSSLLRQVPWVPWSIVAFSDVIKHIPSVCPNVTCDMYTINRKGIPFPECPKKLFKLVNWQIPCGMQRGHCRTRINLTAPPGSSSIIEQRCDGGAWFGQKGDLDLSENLRLTWKASCIWFQSTWKSPRTSHSYLKFQALQNLRPLRAFSGEEAMMARQLFFFGGLCCNQCWSACRVRKRVEVLSFETWGVFNQKLVRKSELNCEFWQMKSTSVKILEKTEEKLKEQLLLPQLLDDEGTVIAKIMRQICVRWSMSKKHMLRFAALAADFLEQGP